MRILRIYSLNNFYIEHSSVTCIHHVAYHVPSTNLSYNWRRWDDLEMNYLKPRLVEFSSCREDGIWGER